MTPTYKNQSLRCVVVCVLLYDGDVLAKWLPHNDFKGDVIDDLATTSTAISTAASASSSCAPSPRKSTTWLCQAATFSSPPELCHGWVTWGWGKFRDNRGRDRCVEVDRTVGGLQRQRWRGERTVRTSASDAEKKHGDLYNDRLIYV